MNTKPDLTQPPRAPAKRQKKLQQRLYDLTHVRHDPSYCLAPGLFRSLAKGDRKRDKLDVIYDYGNGNRIEFTGPEPLGADDLRVLQGLIAMAATSASDGCALVLDDDVESASGSELRQRLNLEWDAVRADAVVARGSYRKLAREIGYANPGDTELVRECIERLWKVSIIAQNGGRRQGSRLLSSYASDSKDGRLFVALNPRLAEAVIGDRPHSRLCMTEIRGLKTDPARLMHQRLCGWIDPGKSGKVEIDTLCGYVWPEQTNPEAMKKRRQTARRALGELAAVGWTVSEYAHGKWELKRPKESSKPHAPDAPAPELLPPPAQIADQICC